jgi:hypothetical protein
MTVIFKIFAESNGVSTSLKINSASSAESKFTFLLYAKVKTSVSICNEVLFSCNYVQFLVNIDFFTCGLWSPSKRGSGAKHSWALGRCRPSAKYTRPYFNTNILDHFLPRISTNQGNLAERFLKTNLHLFDKTPKRCISLFNYKSLHVHLPECCSCVGREIRRVAHLYVSLIFGFTWFTCKQILPSNLLRRLPAVKSAGRTKIMTQGSREKGLGTRVYFR